MRLLLVDDDPDAARVLAKGLRELGYAIDVAGDGGSAIVQAGTTDYDAVLLDVMLPQTDGFAACRTIRESGSAVPILMLTAPRCGRVADRGARLRRGRLSGQAV